MLDILAAGEDALSEVIVVLDTDLIRLKASPISTSYEEAGFSVMDGEISNGFREALTSLMFIPYGRLLLSSQRYAGPAQSAEYLQAVKKKIEQAFELCLRRCTKMVKHRLQSLQMRQNQLQALLDTKRAHQRDLFGSLLRGVLGNSATTSRIRTIVRRVSSPLLSRASAWKVS